MLVRNLFGQMVPPPPRKGERGTGCNFCPLGKQKSLHKIIDFSTVTGKRAMLWSEHPLINEYQTRIPVSGKSGGFLWEELKTYGLTRKDFDIQNVLRCRPKLDSETEKHEPTRVELHC